MDALRVKHPTAAQSLEVLLNELSARFMPSQVERLLSVVHALLIRCYRVALASTAEVPPHMRKELAGEAAGQQHTNCPPHGVLAIDLLCPSLGLTSRTCTTCTGVCHACFNTSGSSRSGKFAAHFQEQFSRELHPESQTFPTSLGHLTERLKVLCLNRLH